ncbi:MAG: DUF2752 domain-containing protein [Myxococcales bacterium]|nr:DUF2752 domain-containing protein [Myxococcales bacterium]
MAGFWTLLVFAALRWLPRCPVVLLFDVPCPGCGLSRALRLLAHGEVAASLSFHPLAIPGLLANAAFVVATVAVTFISGSPFRGWKPMPARVALWAVAVVDLLAFALWGARFAGAFGGPIPI